MFEQVVRPLSTPRFDGALQNHLQMALESQFPQICHVVLGIIVHFLTHTWKQNRHITQSLWFEVYQIIISFGLQKMVLMGDVKRP